MKNQNSILLIHPPVAKPCEPPPGIAKLAGALRANGIDCRIFDANLEGLLHLVDHPPEAADTWSRRATAHRAAHLAGLRSPALYAKAMDRYKRAVADINRIIQMAGMAKGVQLSLANYHDPELSPVRSRDLVAAAREYEKNPFFRFFERRLDVLASDVDIVGFSVNFMSQAICAFAMAGYIRARHPGIRIVFGGGLITSWMRIPGFENPFGQFVDDLVAGPGESALLEMGGRAEATVATGAGYDFTGFQTQRYLAPGLILPYSASEGCYWRRCSFCPETSEKSVYRPHDPKAVVDDIRKTARGIKPVLIHFVDNALSPRFMKYLIEHPPGIPWYAFVRATPHLADPDFVRGLAASGCVMLKLGIESGDPEVLDALDKGVDLRTVSDALKTLRSASIAVYAYLLFGTPAENRRSAEMTRDFTLAHADCIDFLNLAVFNLPAHCREAGRLETAAFYEGDLSLYREFHHPQGWNRNRVRRFLAGEFKALPAIRKIVTSDPPHFTSNHAPLLKLYGQRRT